MKYYVKIKGEEVIKMSDHIPQDDPDGWVEAIYLQPSISDGKSLYYLYADMDKSPVEIKWKLKDREDVA